MAEQEPRIKRINRIFDFTLIGCVVGFALIALYDILK